VVIGGDRQPERAGQQDLAGGGSQQVSATDHFGDTHGGVIRHDRELVGRDIVAPPDHEIPEILAGHEALRALAKVGEGD